MILRDLFALMESEDYETEKPHFDALRRTGFYGAQAAGCIFLARDTKRFLLAHRSEDVQEPGDWGSWGGAINKNEDPETAARREAEEEAGHGSGVLEMIPLYVFRNKTFRYSNFLAIVEHEFDPVTNWETQGYRWCNYGDWPQPLHFGLLAIFNDAASVATIRRVLDELSAQAPQTTPPARPGDGRARK